MILQMKKDGVGLIYNLYKILIMKKLFLVSLVLVLFLTGCKKETPIVSDNIAPEIIFTISTTGWSHTFKSTDVVGGIWELRLKPDTYYNYTILVSDSVSGLNDLSYIITRGTGGYWRLRCIGTPEAPRENVTPTSFIYSINSQLYKSYYMKGSFMTGGNANNSRLFNITITSSDQSDPSNASQLSIPVTIPFETPGLEYGWVNIFG